jgi:diacylglycerol kinase (ATP)
MEARHSPSSARTANAFKGKRGLTRILNAFRYSLAGLSAAYRHEEAFRQEAWLALILIPAALFMPVGGIGKALMVGSVLLVMMVELLNSAIEAVVDRVSLDHHELARRAKDIGSAAVMVSLINVPAVWVLVLFAG